MVWRNRVAADFTDALFLSACPYTLFFFFPHRSGFKWQFLQGVLLNFCSWHWDAWLPGRRMAGIIINWYGKPGEQATGCLCVSMNRLLKRAVRIKAVASVEAIVRPDSMLACDGHIVLYFSKDGFDQRLWMVTGCLLPGNLTRSITPVIPAHSIASAMPPSGNWFTGYS